MIGIEEKDGIAVALSGGVPRSRLSWEQLQSAICDRIQPAVAGYVSIFSVQVGTSSDGESLRLGIRLGFRDRLVSLERLLLDAGFRPRNGLREAYTQRWQEKMLTDLALLEGKQT